MYTLLPCNLSYIVQLYRPGLESMYTINFYSSYGSSNSIIMYACMYSMTVVNVHDQVYVYIVTMMLIHGIASS